MYPSDQFVEEEKVLLSRERAVAAREFAVAHREQAVAAREKAISIHERLSEDRRKSHRREEAFHEEGALQAAAATLGVNLKEDA